MTNIPKTAKIYKQLGETPLEALERFRAEMINSEILSENSTGIEYWKLVPMTYAGRLDPMAEGILIILVGDECKNKEKYLGLDKEYEIEVVFGISTDTHDALGLATLWPLTSKSETFDSMEQKLLSLNLSKYCGKFIQEYPPYSAKTVGGKQLHELARTGELPKKMPTREVEIYSIEKLSNKNDDPTEKTSGKNLLRANNLLEQIISMIDRVHGDFRQEQIKKKWRELLKTKQSEMKLPTSQNTNNYFYSLRCRVKCSGGTYMRTLADKIGQDLGTGAFVLTIKRTKIN